MASPTNEASFASSQTAIPSPALASPYSPKQVQQHQAALRNSSSSLSKRRPERLDLHGLAEGSSSPTQAAADLSAGGGLSGGGSVQRRPSRSSTDDFHSLLQPSPSASTFSSAAGDAVWLSPPATPSTLIPPQGSASTVAPSSIPSVPVYPVAAAAVPELAPDADTDTETETRGTGPDSSGDAESVREGSSGTLPPAAKRSAARTQSPSARHQRYVTAATGTLGHSSRATIVASASAFGTSTGSGSEASSLASGIAGASSSVVGSSAAARPESPDERYRTARSYFSPGGSAFIGTAPQGSPASATSVLPGSGILSPFRRQGMASRSRPGTGNTEATFVSAAGDMSMPESSLQDLPPGSPMRKTSSASGSTGASSGSAVAGDSASGSRARSMSNARSRGENSPAFSAAPLDLPASPAKPTVPVSPPARASSNGSSKRAKAQPSAGAGPRTGRPGLTRHASDASSSAASLHHYGTPPDGTATAVSPIQERLNGGASAVDHDKTPRIASSVTAGGPVPASPPRTSSARWETHPRDGYSESGSSSARERDRDRDSLDPNRYARAAGTASSPDLKTLVQRKAMEAVAQGRISGEMARGILGDEVLSQVVAASGVVAANPTPSSSSASAQDADTATQMASSETGTSDAHYSPKVPPKDHVRRQTPGSGSRDATVPLGASIASGAAAAASPADGDEDGQPARMPAAARSSHRSPLPGTSTSASARGRASQMPGSTYEIGPSNYAARDADPPARGLGLGLATSASTSTTGTLSLADEIAQGSPQIDDKGSGGFRSRMKKTGGFLRSFRSSTRAKSQDPAGLKPQYSSSGTDLHAPSSPGRRSINSQTSSFDAGHGTGDFEGATDVPVPSIPSKYARESGNSAPTRRRDKGPAPAPPVASDSRRPSAASIHSQTQTLGPPSRPARASMPSSPALDSPRKSSTPSAPPSASKSAVAANAAAAGESPTRRRKLSSNASGSDGTGHEMRRAVKAWEAEMEDTLRSSAQDLDRKMDLSPRTQWGPSPQLPEIDVSDKSPSKKGQFMESSQWERSVVPAVNAAGAAVTTPGRNPRSQGSSSSPSPLPGVRVEQPSPVAESRVAARSAQRSRSEMSASDSGSGSLSARDDLRGLGMRSVSAGPPMPVRASTDAGPSSARVVSDPPSAARAMSMDLPPRRQPASPASSDAQSYAPEQSIRVIPRRDSARSGDGADSSVSNSVPRAVPVASDAISMQRRPSVGLPEGAKEDSPALDRTSQRAQDMAARAWKEDEDFLPKDKIAEWLGGPGAINQMARTAYFENFNFDGMRVDVAFRKLCDKLYLKAETQQVDRILEAFSKRFWACNAGSIYGSADVVHSMVFSLLLLNTDLHVADITDRMNRGQFIRNTMAAIEHPSDGRPANPADDSQSNFSDNMDGQPSGRKVGASRGMGATLSPSGASVSSLGHDSSSTPSANPSSQNLPHVRKTSANGTISAHSPAMKTKSLTNGSGDTSRGIQSKAWAVEMESLLKDIYAAVRSEQIRLPALDGSKAGLAPPGGRKGGLSTPGSDRVSLLKRGSIRGIQGLLGASTSTFGSDGSISPGSSSATGFSGADAWTFGSNSSFVSSATSGQQPATALGFASTLTHTIIKESQDEDTDVIPEVEHDDLTDEELALFGPPWAKEGVLTRKHYWEAQQKRAKDKNWVETFVVVSKGVLSMFRFGDTSDRRDGPSSGGAVGGGNWLSNATPLGSISLAHTLANVLPPPGYNRARPHVFALTLPGGAVFFFQAGHEELVHEWVSTCNYWAARQSKEPLPGGVSNMEYGWNKVLPREFDSEEEEELDSASLASDAEGRAPSSMHATRNRSSADNRSVRSGRSGKFKGSGNVYMPWQDSKSGKTSTNFFGSTSSIRSPSLLGSGSAGVHANERIYINEWKQPQLPTVPSTLKEDEQLERVLKHVAYIESELTKHNELRQPMLQLYSPKGANHAKALANWERKSNHLLQELVKYQCYADSLKNAVRLHAEKRSQKLIERADMP